ncbi:MAG: helicase-associated domain-containing protein [Leucobacter sp.]
MSGTLALASAIAEMDRDALASLVRRRRPHAPAGIVDPIGLAAELLRPESIMRAITPLDRRALVLLLDLARSSNLDGSEAPPEIARDDEPIAELLRLGLLGLDGSVAIALPEVSEALQQALRAAQLEPDELRDAPDETADEADADPEARAWVTAALASVAQASEILRTLRDRPARMNRSGTVAVATVRGLAESVGIDPEPASRTLVALEHADLAAPADGALVPTALAAHWLRLDHVDRWLALASAALASMPRPLRAALGSDRSLSAAAQRLSLRFPLLPRQQLAEAEEFAGLAEHLGLTRRGHLSRAAELLLAADRDSARELARQQLPEASAGVYVQPDLSVVVPGPLRPRDEAELAALTAPEHIGAASTRRATEASIAEALKRGIAPADARSAFERISLTGIPQPLDYLLGSLAARVGDISVSEHRGDTGRTRIAVGRGELADTLFVDRALQHLQLQRIDATTLLSRLRAEHVLAALADARYHASGPASDPASETLDAGWGAFGDPDPASTAAVVFGWTPTSEPELSGPLAEMVERVHAAARSEPGTGDFTRRLELAIRDRTAVRVTAEARGQQHVFVLLPASLNAGRLRAADQAAGVERTLPVSMITAVEPA